jgi:hypothetical protein
MQPRSIFQFIPLLVRLYDRFNSDKQQGRLEYWTVWFAVSGFLVHLALIALARSVPSLNSGLLSNLDRNYLHAVYTPFSFILFYEVLLLVFALPRSHTSAIRMQYEIMSLIVIRRVFKDIGEFRDPSTWLSQIDASTMVLMDMVAAIIMFSLVALFRRVSLTVNHSPPHGDLHKFIAIKKSVAVLLLVVLIGLATYNVFHWASGVLATSHATEGAAKDLDYFFFPAFFEFMIFTDIFLLIISIPFFERYEYVIRNAGFVISTVLLRFSLSTPKPYDLVVGLVAIVYGLCVLSVFSYATQIQSDRIKDSHDQ